MNFLKKLFRQKAHNKTADFISAIDNVRDEIKDLRKELESHRNDRFITLESENRIIFWISSGIIGLCYTIIENTKELIYLIPMISSILTIVAQMMSYRKYHEEIDKDPYVSEMKTGFYNNCIDIFLIIATISFITLYLNSKFTLL